MGLVGDHHDVLALGEDRHRPFLLAPGELLDRREHDPVGGDVEQRVEAVGAALDAVGLPDHQREVGLAGEGLRELVVEVVGVGDAHDRRVGKAPVAA